MRNEMTSTYTTSQMSNVLSLYCGKLICMIYDDDQVCIILLRNIDVLKSMRNRRSDLLHMSLLMLTPMKSMTKQSGDFLHTVFANIDILVVWRCLNSGACQYYQRLVQTTGPLVSHGFQTCRYFIIK